MKKILILSAIVLALLIKFSTADAAYNNENITVVTVAEAKNLGDDTSVVLVGKITQSLGNEKYTFIDGTDSITVEIDDDDWNGVDVNAENVVEIRGEVDKDFGDIEIDVDSIKLSK